MNIPHSTIAPKTKVGSCPHGMPLGACPICSGMGGGGGGSSKRLSKSSGEMSWDECYSVWQQMLKAKDQAQKKRNELVQSEALNSIILNVKTNNTALKISALIDKLSEISLKNQPNQIFSKTIATIAKAAIPILNIAKNVVIIAQNLFNSTMNFIQQKFTDISDKLNAIFGELKNFTEKKISDKLKDFKKKFKSIFEINEPEKIDDEDKKINEIEEGMNK